MLTRFPWPQKTKCLLWPMRVRMLSRGWLWKNWWNQVTKNWWGREKQQVRISLRLTAERTPEASMVSTVRSPKSSKKGQEDRLTEIRTNLFQEVRISWGLAPPIWSPKSKGQGLQTLSQGSSGLDRQTSCPSCRATLGALFPLAPIQASQTARGTLRYQRTLLGSKPESLGKKNFLVHKTNLWVWLKAQAEETPKVRLRLRRHKDSINSWENALLLWTKVSRLHPNNSLRSRSLLRVRPLTQGQERPQSWFLHQQ